MLRRRIYARSDDPFNPRSILFFLTLACPGLVFNELKEANFLATFDVAEKKRAW